MLSDRKWQLSRGAKPALKKLQKTFEAEDCWGFDYAVEGCFEDPNRYIGQLAASAFFKNLDHDDELKLRRIFEIDSENARWEYGHKLAADQTTTEPVYTNEFVETDKLVIGGVVGYELVENFPKLAKAANKIKGSELDKLATIGGVAMTVVNKPLGLFTSASHSVDLGDFTDTIEVGDPNMNGDFGVRRYLEFNKTARDPAGYERLFAPALPEKLVNGYDKIEPGVLTSVLQQAVQTFGIEKAQNIAREVLAETDGKLDDAVVGPFADYGIFDGKHDFYGLLHTMKHFEEDGVFSERTFPVSMRAQFEADGLLLTCSDKSEKRRILIANHELKDFLTVLLLNRGGRTTPESLANILRWFADYQF